MIVNLARAVDAQADEEPVLLEEARPVVVEQGAVGLQVVLDALPGLGVFLLQRDDLLEELEAQQRGLAALPGEDDFVGGDALDVVPHEPVEQLVVHVPAARTARQLLLAQIKAVGAVEVAGRSGRLGHHVESPAGALREPLRRRVTVERSGHALRA